MSNRIGRGDNLIFKESQLTHPFHGDGLVNADDPVLLGRIPGVSAADADDPGNDIVIQTVGVFSLSVTATFHIKPGATIYADPATMLLGDDVTDTPFGHALDEMVTGTTATIRVKLLGATAGAIGFGS